MIPVTLTLRNFLSYGDRPQTLDFTQFRVACLSGDNGNGKSALLDAMTYALWGQARKGRHDRKPDDGLLRLGATHMEVEFTFDLDDERYRIMRSYRRRPRSSVSELELQILDPSTTQYRPLTQAGAPTVTQGQIDHLLSMDYETFTNSAFLMQGHADAFTRKSPRDRKQLLGRILGVGRYDRLQEMARKRLNDIDTQLQQLTRQIEEAAEALSSRGEVDEQLEQVSSRVEEVGSKLIVAEEELAALQERAGQAQALNKEQEWDEKNQRDLSEALVRLIEEESHLQERMREDGALLEQASTIEEQARQLATCQRFLHDNHQRRVQLQELHLKERSLLQQIEAERHQIQQTLARWQERHGAATVAHQRCQELIDQEGDIEAAWLLVSQARDQVVRQREHRRAWDELARRRQQLENEVSIAEQRLHEKIRFLVNQQTSIEELLAQAPKLAEMIEEAESALTQSHHQSVLRRDLGDAGNELRSRITQARQRRGDLAQQVELLNRRRSDLQQADEANCPLCGTDLDEQHRLHLTTEFDEQIADLTEHLETLDRDLDRMQIELAERRREYAATSSCEEVVAACQENLASLRGRQTALVEQRTVGETLKEEIQGLNESLQSESYCSAVRQQIAETQQLMSGIDYQPEHLEEAERVAIDANAQTRKQQLSEARQQQAVASAQAEEALSMINAHKEMLTEKNLIPAAQEQLHDLKEQILRIDIDEELHARQSERAEQLRDAALRLERLQVARSRQPAAMDQMAMQLKERSRIHSRQRELDQREQERAARLREVAGVEQACAAALEIVTLRRSERDGLVERRGALRTRAEQLQILTTRIQQQRQERKRLQKKAWLHEQLVEAFGKDGIQALIIEHAIPEIEEEANAILRRLTDNRIQISIESIRDLKGGGSRETLDVKISDEVGERGYDLYSGGEAFRSDFALRLALSKVLARRAGTRLRTLIIDEGFGTQDRSGLEQLKESIHKICSDFDKVIIVTHLEELKSAFPTQIEVTKYPGRGSEFEIRQLA